MENGFERLAIPLVRFDGTEAGWWVIERGSRNVSLDPVAGSVLRTVRIEGVDPALYEMGGLSLKAGRLPTADEHQEGAPVMLASADVAHRIWPDAADPIGQTLSAGGRSLKLVGIVAAAHEAA